jgi:GNAT superfamily N-acetyltransferase
LLLQQDFVNADKNLHDLKTFDCGNATMDEFLGRYALKHSKLGLSRTYVLAEEETANKASVAVYYTLAAATVTRAEIPITQSLPTYPIPVVMLARLAVDQRYQGKGLGAKALVYALRQAANLSHSGLPAYGLILDVIDEQALKFYQHFDLFKPFTEDPMRLFVSMKTLEQI